MLLGLHESQLMEHQLDQGITKTSIAAHCATEYLLCLLFQGRKDLFDVCSGFGVCVLLVTPCYTLGQSIDTELSCKSVEWGAVVVGDFIIARSVPSVKPVNDEGERLRILHRKVYVTLDRLLL